MKLWALLLSLFVASAFAQKGVLFKTTAGDLLFELDYENAPRTSKYFANLASSSLFEGLNFIYLNKEVGARTEFIENTLKSKSSNYGDFISPQDYEKSGLKHKRGALSLTVTADKPKGTSSFGLLFADQPSLDGKRTVFGRLIRGEKILKHLEQYDVDEADRPVPLFKIISSKLIDPKEFETLELAVFKSRKELGIMDKMSSVEKVLFICIGVFWILCVLVFFAPVPKVTKTISLTFLLVLSFGLLDLLGASIQHSQSAGIMFLFIGFATFRLMGNYE